MIPNFTSLIVSLVFWEWNKQHGTKHDDSVIKDDGIMLVVYFLAKDSGIKV